MSKFARLFELENDNQVLLVSSYNDDEDVFVIKVSTEIDGVALDVSMSYDNEDDSILEMENFNQEKAILFFNKMENFLNNPQL